MDNNHCPICGLEGHSERQHRAFTQPPPHCATSEVSAVELITGLTLLIVLFGLSIFG